MIGIDLAGLILLAQLSGGWKRGGGLRRKRLSRLVGECRQLNEFKTTCIRVVLKMMNQFQLFAQDFFVYARRLVAKT